MILSPDAVTFILVSFEGPDPYSLAGGLGVRISHLAETLAARGFETHLFFVGDPALPGRESHHDGRLAWHRWCQWISEYHPSGVYDGEEGKLRDFNDSLPPFIMEQVIRPALEAGRLPVVLAEEWHTAEALIRVNDRLRAAGLRERSVLFWNANNTKSFDRVDWPRLNDAAQLTTVSRYMKHWMWNMGLDLNPLVIPNGIPGDLLDPVDEKQIVDVRRILAPDDEASMMFKVGRFDPDKRWLMAVEAAAQLKARGCPVAFPLRGGTEPHGVEVLERARGLGLRVAQVEGTPKTWEEVLALFQSAGQADVYNITFFMPQAWLRPFYAAADAVLANSGHEPFGLVGLEVMAAGGIVFTGATGEEYTLGGRSAFALDTDRPEEIVSQVLELRQDPARVLAMRHAAREAATAFTWKDVSDILLDKIKFVAQEAGAVPRARPVRRRPVETRVQDVVIYAAVHQPRRRRLPVRKTPPPAPPRPRYPGFCSTNP